MAIMLGLSARNVMFSILNSDKLNYWPLYNTHELPHTMIKDISVVIPIKNEPGIFSVIDELRKYFPKDQIIVVDDSDVKDRSDSYKNKFLYCTHFFGSNTGLGSAVRFGVQNSQTKYILVMDGDGQHPIEIIPDMINHHIFGNTVVGVRNIDQSVGLSYSRKVISKILNKIANSNAKTKCSDPMSGFFLTSRENILRTKTNGFKILYEILLNLDLSIYQIPISLGPRISGESKASVKQVFELINTPRWS